MKFLESGAYIVINTEGDNRYYADHIEKLVAPLLNNEADIVIGERSITEIQHICLMKKMLQKLGTFVVKALSSVNF